MIAEPRISFGMIVLNGEPFILRNLRTIYPYAHQILIVEGASPKAAHAATPSGHSADGTLEVLQDYIRREDPENKVILVTAESCGYSNGFWPGDKDEQSQAYAKKANGDWLWQVDVDEFYLPEDIELVRQYLCRHPEKTCLTFNPCHFWGGLDYVVRGGLFMSRSFAGEPFGAVRRIFRWGPGYEYLTHRPPTVRNASGISSDSNKVNISRIYPSVRMYHYFMVFPKQVLNKGRYYQNMGWGHEKDVDKRYQRLFAGIGLTDRFRIFTHRGTHNWLERFAGKHPPQMLELRQAMLENQNNIEARDTQDIDQMLSERRYRYMTRLFYAFELTRVIFEDIVSLAKGRLKQLMDGKEIYGYLYSMRRNG